MELGQKATNLSPVYQQYSTSMNSTVPTGASTSDRLTTVLSYGVLLLLIYLVFRIYEPFLAALGWAAILLILAVTAPSSAASDTRPAMTSLSAGGTLL